MTDPHRRPERRAPRWLRWVNPLNRFLLQRGIGPRPQHLLTTTGRRTARAHTTPIAVLTLDGERYVVAGFDGCDWAKNARATGHGRLRRGRAVHDVELVEVPCDQRATILRAFARKIRGGQAFLAVAADAPLSAFAQAAPQHPVFRLLTPETPESMTV